MCVVLLCVCVVLLCVCVVWESVTPRLVCVCARAFALCFINGRVRLFYQHDAASDYDPPIFSVRLNICVNRMLCSDVRMLRGFCSFYLVLRSAV